MAWLHIWKGKKMEKAQVHEQTKEIKPSMTPTGQRLRAYIDRIERLDEDKKAVMQDIKEVFAEAKGDGLEVKALRTRYQGSFC